MPYQQNINQHLKEGNTKRLRKRHFVAAILAVLVIAIGLSLNTNPAGASKTTVSKYSAAMQRLSIALPSDRQTLLTEGLEKPSRKIHWHTEKVRPGDSLARIFDRLGLPARTLHEIMASDKQAQAYQHLRAGQTIDFGFDGIRTFVGLRFSPEQTRTIKILHNGEDWQTHLIKQEVEIRLAHASGVINDSLFLSGNRAGLSDNTIMQLAGIFGWDIDFALDIRKGDRFSLIYETRHLRGEKIADGNIIAAEFINRGRHFKAIRYTSADGVTDYYSAEGKSMRKAFLRTPVKFSRISSRFTHKRWHPVLKKWRSHKGVDYAAPRGTPVKATSDGKISFRGRKGGYGKAIFIKNGKTYTTVYGHLNSYARGSHKGRRVKQGQIIGYVGSTGLATGPHLHYELRINGVHRNPLTAKLPKAQPIAKQYRLDFKESTRPLLARLALISNAHLASVSPRPDPDNKILSN